MGKVFDNATIMQIQNMTVAADEDAVAGAKIPKADMEAIDRLCRAEGIPSRSEFIREALILRMTYTGDDYLKLVGYPQQVKEHLRGLTSPVTVNRR